MALQADGFDRAVALPPELKIAHIREAIEHVEERAEQLIDIYFEQANVFGGIVGISRDSGAALVEPIQKAQAS